MRRRSRDHQEGPGLDSFLDIVANLVGILIILVMVIGVHARSAIIAVATGETGATAAVDEAEQRRLRELGAVEGSLTDLAQQIHNVSYAIESQLDERNQWQVLVSAGQESIRQQAAQLDEEQRKQMELESQIALEREELANLQADLEAAEHAEPPPQVLEHMPTPLARTVFGAEEHFRLLNGRIVYVPVRELSELLQRDMEARVSRLRDADSLTEVVGPVGDFRLQYTLAKRQVSVNGQLGPAQREIVQLERYTVIPMSDAPGETLAEAMHPSSLFMSQLSRFDPNSITITVWTYPDSFSEFRELKAALAERGYLIAARPLPAGWPISGSPDGSRSSSQ